MSLHRLIGVVLATLMLVALAGCASAQETVWRSFVDAVREKRADDALGYIDFERMAQKAFGDDAEAAAGLALLGESDGAAGLLEELFRDAFSKGEFDSGSTNISAEARKAKSIKTEGDVSTLTFEADSGEFVVEMERIDGDWKIVGFESASAQ
jgi:hypothetical protein